MSLSAETTPYREESNMMKKSSVPVLLSWALYDWANSAFPAVIQTFVFAAFFVKSVAPNAATGTAAWGTITGLSAFIVALISPFLGAVADKGGGRKLWLAAFTILCVIPTLLLWYVKPSPDYMWMALLLVGIGAVGAEGAYIFYNAMLPELSPPSQLGRWSGWGWAFGYGGGMAALIISLFAFINPNPWIPLEHTDAIPIRATFILTAIWYAVFSLPLFLMAPRSPPSGKSFREASVEGAKQLWNTVREVGKYRTIVKFLIGKMLYVDGLATLFAFGGIYAATVFGMEEMEVLQFGIAMNVVAGLGAASLSFLDDMIGSKKVILLSLLGLIIPGTAALFVTAKWQFWVLGLLMCVFVGPVQSSSRALMARMAPEHMRREMFGFYMLSGKATAFLGPLLYGWIAYITGSLRWGMSTIILLFVLGGIIIYFLPKKLEIEN